MKRLLSISLAMMLLFTSLLFNSCTPEDRRDEIVVDSVSLDAESGIYRVTWKSIFDSKEIVFEYQKPANDPEIMVECIVQIDYFKDKVMGGIINPTNVTILSDMIEHGKVVCLEELEICMISNNQINRELIILHSADSARAPSIKTGDEIKIYYKNEVGTTPKSVFVVHLEKFGHSELTDEEKEIVKDYTLIDNVDSISPSADTTER